MNGRNHARYEHDYLMSENFIDENTLQDRCFDEGVEGFFAM